MEIKKNKSKIVLMGFMGSGKTTLGKKLADQMKYDFIDLDHYIENKHKKSIENIFKEEGEAIFRQIERESLQDFSDKKCYILSLGGGTPCSPETIAWIKTHFLSIYLKPSLDVILYRLRGNKKKRPLLENLKEEELEPWVRRTLKERETYYLQADIIIEEMELQAGVGEIVRHLYM